MVNLYETDKLLEEYLLLHYANPETILPWSFGPKNALEFPKRCITELLNPGPGSRALELGCSVGRASFELSVGCDEVIGIDFSESFIREAQRLGREGTAVVSYAEEGDLRQHAEIRLDPRFRRDKVAFEVGDATALRPDLGSFDLVLAANLLCRVPNPTAVLERLPSLVVPGGQLAITSPYTWMEEYTPKERWLGGFLREGIAVRSLESLKQTLGQHFDLLETIDMPFLIREHGRKFQWSVAQGSRWLRHPKA